MKLPGRLAASGYSALAVDLLSRKGGSDPFPTWPRQPALSPALPCRTWWPTPGPGSTSCSPGARTQGGRHGLLLRRRHDLVAAGGGRRQARRRAAVLRAAARGARLLEGESSGARHLRRDRHPGQRLPSPRPRPPWRPPSCPTRSRSWPAPGTPSSTRRNPTGTTPRRRPTPTRRCSNGSCGTCHEPPVSSGAVLTLVAVALALVILGLFRLLRAPRLGRTDAAPSRRRYPCHSQGPARRGRTGRLRRTRRRCEARPASTGSTISSAVADSPSRADRRARPARLDDERRPGRDRGALTEDVRDDTEVRRPAVSGQRAPE